MTGRTIAEQQAAAENPERAAAESLAALADTAELVRLALAELIDARGVRPAARITGLSLGTIRRWADIGPPVG